MSEDQNTLLDAAASGDEEQVRRLLGAGAAVDSTRDDGSTPLLLAALSSHAAVVQLLLEHGASVSQAKANGATPVFAAAASDAVECIRILAEANANVDSANLHGVTPLQIAAHKNNAGSLTLLLTLGADVMLADDAGNTALHKAARSDALPAIDALLSHALPESESAAAAAAGAPAESPAPAEAASSEGSASLLSLLHRENIAGQTPAEFAMLAGAPSAASKLMKIERVAATRQKEQLDKVEGEAVRFGERHNELIARLVGEEQRCETLRECLAREIEAAEAESKRLSFQLVVKDKEAAIRAQELEESKSELGCAAAALSVTREAHATASDDLRCAREEMAQMKMELNALKAELGAGTLEACKQALKDHALKLAAAEEEARVSEAAEAAVTSLLTMELAKAENALILFEDRMDAANENASEAEARAEAAESRAEEAEHKADMFVAMLEVEKKSADEAMKHADEAIASSGARQDEALAMMKECEAVVAKAALAEAMAKAAAKGDPGGEDTEEEEEEEEQEAEGGDVAGGAPVAMPASDKMAALRAAAGARYREEEVSRRGGMGSSGDDMTEPLVVVQDNHSADDAAVVVGGGGADSPSGLLQHLEPTYDAPRGGAAGGCLGGLGAESSSSDGGGGGGGMGSGGPIYSLHSVHKLYGSPYLPTCPSPTKAAVDVALEQPEPSVAAAAAAAAASRGGGGGGGSGGGDMYPGGLAAVKMLAQKAVATGYKAAATAAEVFEVSLLEADSKLIAPARTAVAGGAAPPPSAAAAAAAPGSSTPLEPPRRPRPIPLASTPVATAAAPPPAATAAPSGGSFWATPDAVVASDGAAKEEFDAAYSRAMRSYKANDFVAAEGLFRHALDICPPSDPQLAVVYNNLAATMEKLNMPREAEALYLQGLAICQERMPADHPRIKHIQMKLGQLRSSLFAFPGLPELQPRTDREVLSDVVAE